MEQRPTRRQASTSHRLQNRHLILGKPCLYLRRYGPSLRHRFPPLHLRPRSILNGKRSTHSRRSPPLAIQKRARGTRVKRHYLEHKTRRRSIMSCCPQTSRRRNKIEIRGVSVGGLPWSF